MSLKNAIEKLMDEKKIRRVDIARESGLSKSFITELLHNDEKKRKTGITIDTLERIASVFGLSGSQLLMIIEQD